MRDEGKIIHIEMDISTTLLEMLLYGYNELCERYLEGIDEEAHKIHGDTLREVAPFEAVRNNGTRMVDQILKIEDYLAMRKSVEDDDGVIRVQRDDPLEFIESEPDEEPRWSVTNVLTGELCTPDNPLGLSAQAREEMLSPDYDTRFRDGWDSSFPVTNDDKEF